MSKRDGMFRLERPAEALRFTGERLTSAISGEVEIEHYHRYCLARDHCVDRDVLDVASGEGYGSAILAGVARRVVGLERDEEAVAFARSSYSADNLAFEHGDALELPFEDASFDVVVSFETIEHLPDQNRFLQEIKRVLRPDGLLVISSPDRLVHSGLGMPVNPHHIRELSAPEFDALLGEYFRSKTLLAQRAIVGSVVLPSGTPSGALARSYERRDDVTIEATTGFARAVYLVALASDGPLPEVVPSVFAGPHSIGALWDMVGQGRREAASLRSDLASRDDECARIRRDLENAGARFASAEADAAKLRDALAAAEERRRTYESELRAEAAAERDRAAAEIRSALLSCDEASSERERLAAELATLSNSKGVRIGLYIARKTAVLPRPLREGLRRAASAMFARRDTRRGVGPAPLVPPQAIAALPGNAQMPPIALPSGEQDPADAGVLLAGRFAQLRPISAFPVASAQARLSILTDSIGPSSLFGGVGTSLILGALLAGRLGASLRIVTRTEPPDAAAVLHVLKNNGIAFDGSLEAIHVGQESGHDLPVGDGDLFLTTSWWTTRSLLGSVPPERVVALVQEDERMFYPLGDEHLRCTETLAEAGIVTVVNTKLLFDHLTADERLANIGRDGLWFEPAFPSVIERPLRTGKRRLFFYARPNNARNLFWRGIEALDAAVAEGVFASGEWGLHFVGKDVPQIRLGGGVVPSISPPMEWGAYQALIASMDAGFVLMDTPHPSYPPLDLAAAGAAVLTNTHPGKGSLASYSRNILTAPPSLSGMVEGLRRLQDLALDDDTRAANRAADRIARDWTAALSPTVERLAGRFGQA